MEFLVKAQAGKFLSRMRYSKIWNLIRRLRPKPGPVVRRKRNPVDELLALAEKKWTAGLVSERAKNSKLVIDGQRFLISGFRRDGVGIQSMLRVCVMFLARQANATYVHLPFLRLAHQGIDPVGRHLTPEEWAAKWEAFFNLGKDEVHVADLTNAMGRAALAEQLSAEDRQFGRKGAPRELLPDMVAKIRGRDGEVSGIYTFDLGLCQQSREFELFLDAEFIQILQERFETNGYTPKKALYSEQYLNIAVHIRRGDVWEAAQAGSKTENKLVSEEYYVGLLERLQDFFGSSPKPVRFHILSDGRPEDFVRFTFASECEASLKLESGLLIENIQFHLRQSTFDTIYHMIKAPIFVPGKSTFSVMAVLLGKSHVFYENEISEFYQYDLLEKYMAGNPRFISLTGLEDRGAGVMEALTESGLMDC